MAQILDIAMAASARSWPDRLHRHVLDHGGARVVGRVLGASQAMEVDYDILLIDDVCSFLSPGLVAMLRQDGRHVLGVYDRDEGPDAKRRLMECGISDVIESDAMADEFLAQVSTVAETALPSWIRSSDGPNGRIIGVVGAAPGVGATEVAVGLAWSLARRVDSVLVDIDSVRPSIAQRLDLPPHPNLLTLVDAVVHGYPAMTAEVALDRLRVVPGVAIPRVLPDHELAMVLDFLASRCDVLVVDLGSAVDASEATMSGCDALVVVFSGDPVGLTRLVRDGARWRRLAETTAMVAIANRCPGRRFHRHELVREVDEALGPVPVITTTHDEGVLGGAWEGAPVSRGQFARAMARMAGLVAEAVSR